MYWRRIWKRRFGQGASWIGLRFSKIWGRGSDRSVWVARLGLIFLIGTVGLALVSFVMFAVVARELPNPDKIVRKEGFSTKIYDRNGKLLYDVYSNQKRIAVELSEVPKYLQQGTIAIEDKGFYKHGGFDPLGWLRIAYNIVFKRRVVGASTLTQQLVKNVLLTPQRSLWRKVKEFILAVQIEKRFTKDQILQMYLNEAPYGGTAWGVEAGAETYFGKRVSELNLIESAILAGLPQRPSGYSPFSGNGAYKGRTMDVLRRMREDEYITQTQEKEALAQLDEVKFSTESGQIKAPHFVMYVKQLLEDRYGEKLVEQGGLSVTTTLDLDLQERAQQIVSEEIAKAESLHITNGAAVVMDPITGEILTMVGSKNYFDPNYDGKFNVTTASRQPGSAIKPVTYLTAFKEGYTPSSMLMDVETIFPGGDKPEYKPANYDGKFRGPVQLRFALANSLNIPSVKLLALVGIKDVLSTAYEMGIKTMEPTQEVMNRLGLSMALGGGEVKLLELVSAYSVFSNSGFRVEEPISILKVTERNGRVLEEAKPELGKKIIDEKYTFLINSILSDNKAREAVFGPRSLLYIPNRSIAVKTGTTNDRRDNWTIGWGFKSKIVGVWVGNNDNSPMKQVSSGVSGASPIWRRIIMAALDKVADKSFDVPSGMVTVDVDEVSGFRAHDGFPSRSEFFIDGTEPNGDDSVHKKIKVCKSSGRLATAIDLARGDYDEKEFFTFKEVDPTGLKDGVNMWQKGIDDWVTTQTDSRYHPPTDNCSSADEVSVEIREPNDRSTVNSNDVKIKVEPITTDSVRKVEIFVDGTSRTTFTSGPYEVTVYMDNGVHTVKAVFEDNRGKKSEREIIIGVNLPWNPTPTPLPTSIPATPSPVPTLLATPTP